MLDAGHGSPTPGKRAGNMSLFSGHYHNPPKKRKIKSFELENTEHQTIEIEDMLSILDIQAQGDGMYMYVYQNVTDRPSAGALTAAGYPFDPNYYEPHTQKVELWIVRNDQEYSPDEMKGVAYVKTVVVKDVAYHFFCNHQLTR